MSRGIVIMSYDLKMVFYSFKTKTCSINIIYYDQGNIMLHEDNISWYQDTILLSQDKILYRNISWPQKFVISR